MKLLSVLKKGCLEQIRNFWIFILTISLAPFFIFMYYLMTEAYKPNYKVSILNHDQGIQVLEKKINYGDNLIATAKTIDLDTFKIPLTIKTVSNRAEAVKQLHNKKTNAVVIIPENFSQYIHGMAGWDSASINIEFIGDLTDVNYMVSAIWAGEILNNFIYQATQKINPIMIKETSLGLSGSISEFDMYVPGILILSIIMLMFSASIALITEVEHKTMLRLKLSRISAFEFLSGITIIQVAVGLLSILLTLAVAVWLGFDLRGSLSILLLIAILTSISIIAFSVIVAAVTKTANEILIVGNFPLFLFMFFSGAAFPMKSKELFVVADYPITLQGLMSATHAVSALKKVLIFEMGFQDIIPELTALVFLTILYFIIGIWIFQRRHMRVQ